MRRDIRPILATVDVGAHSIRQSIEPILGRDSLTEERSQQNEPGRVVVGGNGNVPACQVAPRTETSLLPSNTFEQTDQQPVQDDANVESPLLQQKGPPTTEEEELTGDAVAIQERIDAHLVEVGKSKGMEWKVSENMPVYACGNGVDSANAMCVFALCGNCYKIPNTRIRNAGRKRSRAVVPTKGNCCNHQDMHTLRSFDAPSFFTAKFRGNELKHFPTKCAVCEVGFRDRLSSAELEMKRM
jgi:hypothetical protein